MIDLDTKLIRLDADMDKAHQLVHGDASTVVQTEGGAVRSFAKVTSDQVLKWAAMDQQRPLVMLRGTTTNNVAQDLVIDGFVSAADSTTLANNSAVTFTIQVVGRCAATNDAASWVFAGLIIRGASASATAVIGGVDTLSHNSTGKDGLFGSTGAAAWAATVYANVAQGSIGIKVTGVNGKTIVWSARIKSIKVAN